MSPAEPGVNRPFFIVGTERSGSNLLRLILNSHSSMYVPHPPHIVHYFAPLERYYGDLDDDTQFRRLIRDIIRLVHAHIHQWDVAITVPAVTAAARWRTIMGVASAIYDLALAKSGKNFWGCKSTFMIDHVEMVLRHYPGAKFIHLVRDPRDVAASSKMSVFNPYHPELTARLWRRQQAVAGRHSKALGIDQWFKVKYEDLIRQPEAIVGEICMYLGVAFEPQMLTYYRKHDALKCARLSASWRNLAKPILSQNAGRHLSGLSPKECRAVELVAWELMAENGYQPAEANARFGGDEARGAAMRVLVADTALRLQGEFRSLCGDKNHWRRWRRAAVLASISARCRLRAMVGKLWSRRRHRCKAGKAGDKESLLYMGGAPVRKGRP
jgi:hypothetical protein